MVVKPHDRELERMGRNDRNDRKASPICMPKSKGYSKKGVSLEKNNQAQVIA